MAVFQSNVPVRLSMFVRLNEQVAQIDRLFFGQSSAFDSAWGSGAFFNAAITGGLVSQFKACITSTAGYLGMKLYYKPASGPPILAQDQTDAGDCTGNINYGPSQIAGLIQWKSDIGGGAGRGRTYIPFVPATAIGDNGLPSAGYRTSIGALAANMLGGYTVPNEGGGGGSVTVVPCTRYILPAPSNLPAPMTAQIAALGFATQRRRGFFGKPNNNPF